MRVGGGTVYNETEIHTLASFQLVLFSLSEIPTLITPATHPRY
jgi:hypothetical protein